MKGSQKYYAKLIVLFIIFYIIQYFLGESGLLLKWNSPLFFVLPFIGFFLMCAFVDWGSKYFELHLKTNISIPIILVILCLIAYWVVQYIYWYNLFTLSGQSQVVFDYWNQLKQAPFTVFFFGALFGWISIFILEKRKKSQ